MNTLYHGEDFARVLRAARVSVVGVGIDIVDPARMERLLKRGQLRFLPYAFHGHELSRPRVTFDHLSVVWALKEAVLKVCGVSLSAESLSNIHILRDGQYISILLEGALADTARLIGVKRWVLSVQSSTGIVVALVAGLGEQRDRAA